ncbi:MAG: ABC transporter ATP-binding protein [Clostridia bacterium]|nr:ABC transporter ATP-binding protein [Clostridia bacterium]
MKELAIKVENVSKEYRLGMIGGGTLKAELQSKIAKLFHKDDPNLKIGQKVYGKNEKFLALDDLSLEINKGEAIGIIGHNGAGKSTLLKLICRVTAPTSGKIYINGRITSMLEVGTGFHEELTGRENVYLNGAILGMTKEEIDECFDEIVEFSEVGQFIDTPVKRYSSGMRVKLGFAVASHLNSEIMIMDEVLAVGDVNFQNKCINRMRRVAKEEGRTVLYVSHNMATVKGLCDRCIVLKRGKVAFVGPVEDAISVYVQNEKYDNTSYFDLTQVKRPSKCNLKHKLNSVEILDSKNGTVDYGEKVHLRLSWTSKPEADKLKMKFIIKCVDLTPVGISLLDEINYTEGENVRDFVLDTSYLIPGRYAIENVFYNEDENGNAEYYDRCICMRIEILHSDQSTKLKHWFKDWGNAVLPCITELS